jgi:hypothetical protein
MIFSKIVIATFCVECRFMRKMSSWSRHALFLETARPRAVGMITN